MNTATPPILVKLVEPDPVELNARTFYRTVGVFISRALGGFMFGVGFWLAAQVIR